MANPTTKKILGTAFNVIVGRDKKRHAHGDPTREVFETIVFVVVLVLMLKLFVAEAFVIPTGSMASTLWGDQVKVECPECGYTFPASAAVQGGVRNYPTVVACQNCGNEFRPSNAQDWNSGDRVLVAKYDYHIRDPRRFDVPVFKYPREPYNAMEKTAMNYIKRLIGLPGETIAIYKGDLYRTTVLTYSTRPHDVPPKDLWRVDFTYPNDPDAIALFNQGGFELIRKGPEEILAVQRLLFDLDLQPKSLTGLFKVRWQPVPSEEGAGWTMEEKGFRHSGETLGWVRYQHVEPGSWGRESQSSTPRQPVEIRDYLAYNTRDARGSNWVPDLIVECKAEFSSANDRLTLELVKAGDRFQAEFDNGRCRLYRAVSGDLTKRTMLAEQSTDMKSGRYDLRFANVDSRLTVWVDGHVLPFGPAADYDPPSRESFDKTTLDVNEPVRIGATGNISVSKVKLYRDVYYTLNPEDSGSIHTQYVQPGHYYCLGDNSASSADGRSWGLVPERLLLGRAVVIYWPLSRIRVIK